MSDMLTLEMPRELVEFIEAQTRNVGDKWPEMKAVHKIAYRALHASPGFLVYFKALRGEPEAQIWPMGLKRLNQKPIPILEKYPLIKQELDMSLAQLCELYPCQWRKPENEKEHAAHGEGHTTAAD